MARFTNSGNSDKYSSRRVARCVCCNKVNRDEIQTDEGDLSYKGFYELESYGQSGSPAYFCFECEESIRDVQSEWSVIDDLEDDEFEEDEDYD